LLMNTEHDGPAPNVREDAKRGTFVENLHEERVHGAEQTYETFLRGAANRRVGQTNMNADSSRSHSVFTISVESRTKAHPTAPTTKKSALLHLVDLAGSERQKSTDAAGERLKEASAINKSLSALGNVISALASESGHIPYRDHKLTMLMSDSLGGNAKTLMFVNVSPTDDNLEETQNSLTYATRVRTIKNDTSKDVVNKEMARLKAALAAARAKSGDGPETQDIANARQGELK